MSGKLKLSVLLAVSVIAVTSVNLPAQADTSWSTFSCEKRADKIARSTVANNSDFDVVIYGGTPSGVAAATTAANQGKKVLILSESSLFGGSISNGLSATDIGSIYANVGLAKEFLNQVQSFYHTTDFRTEPKVAECIFQGWLSKRNITTGINTVLDSVAKSNNKITDLNFHTSTSQDSVKVTGKTFIDASYAGDLMFESGVKTRLGMSDYYTYNETVTDYRKLNLQFRLKDQNEIATAEEDFSKLPQVTISSSLTDYKTQIKTGMPSFTYRLCVTKNPNNLVPFAKTADYETYAPAWRTWMKYYYGYNIQKEPVVKPNGTVLTQLWRLSKLPNNKFDLNAYFSSFTNLTMPKEYFDNPTNRPAILAKYTGYLQSFLWFVQNDDSVPKLEANALAGFGLCADEFASSANWPQQPYLREGRRLIGQTTLTARDVLLNRIKADGVAVGAYPLDSKPTLFIYSNGVYARDRGVMFRAPLYEIPLSAMLPKQGPTNLIVSVGISASPAAYASIRMEPQYLQLGQAAGFAAAIAVDRGTGFSQSLATPIRTELAKANGFKGITSICLKMNGDLRKYWGFVESNCITKNIGLVIAN
jgi:hypothetical protein